MATRKPKTPQTVSQLAELWADEIVSAYKRRMAIGKAMGLSPAALKKMSKEELIHEFKLLQEHAIQAEREVKQTNEQYSVLFRELDEARGAVADFKKQLKRST